MKWYAVGLLLVIICLSGCKMQEEKIDIYAMDTVMTIKAYGENSKEALAEVKKEILELDKKFDRNDTDSEIYKLNNDKTALLSDSTAMLLKQAVDIGKMTNGCFNVLIAPVMDLWGFNQKDYRVPSDTELKEILKCTDLENIELKDNTATLKNGAGIDLGGIAKGYASDIVSEIFDKYGIESGIISLGGNVAVKGKKDNREAWTVAIESPDKSGEYVGMVKVSDKAVVTSGGYNRYFEKNGKIYHHIIDPKTGYPSENNIKSVTIICDNGLMADALSTALFVMGAEDAKAFWQQNRWFDFVIVTQDNRVSVSKGIEDVYKSVNMYEIVE